MIRVVFNCGGVLLLGALVSSCTEGGAADAGPSTGTQASLTWEEVAPCPAPRHAAMGAWVGGRLHVYDPATNAWTAGVPLPGAQAGAGVVSDGQDIYLVGGFKGFPGTATVEAWKQDLATGRWTALPPLPRARAALALVHAGGRLHAMGGLGHDGQTDTADHEALDLSATPLAWTYLADVPNPRSFLGGALVESAFLVVGGRRGWDELTGQRQDLNRYEIAEGVWFSRAGLPQARSDIGASTLAHGGRLVVVGGSTSALTPSDQVLAYDPRLDRWKDVGRLPAPRRGAVAAAWGQKLVVTTGAGPGVDATATTWVGCCL
jgi:hypothetical protein